MVNYNDLQGPFSDSSLSPSAPEKLVETLARMEDQL